MAATRPVTSAGTRGVEAIFLSPADEVAEEEGESAVSASQGNASTHAGGGGSGGGGQQKQQELWTRQQQQPQSQPRQQQTHEVRFREENDSVTTTSNEAHYGGKSAQKPLKDASGKASTSGGKAGGRRVSIQQQNGDEDDNVQQLRHHPLRKSRSVSDVQAEAENYALSSVTSTSSVTSLMGASPSQLKENKQQQQQQQNQQRRRMSISITPITSNSHSRRSSIGGGSIIISLSRPDSPVPFIIQSPTSDDDQNQSFATASDTLLAADGVDASSSSPAAATDASGKVKDVPPHLLLMADESLEFLRIHRTAATVHMATRFRTSNSTLYPPGSGPSSSSGGGKLSHIIDRRRRGSTPSIPRLNLKDEDAGSGSGGGGSENSSRRMTRKAQRRRTSSGGSSHRGYFLPASRPSSVMAEASVLAYHQQQQLDLSRSTSPVTIAAVQLGKVSRPWTPARSPSPVNLHSPTNSRSGRNSRNSSNFFFRGKTPQPMAAPLQSLNQKVHSILGCATNILDFYNLRPDMKQKQMDPIRAARLVKSQQMIDKKGPDLEKAQARLQRFRKKEARQQNAIQQQQHQKQQHQAEAVLQNMTFGKKIKSIASTAAATADNNSPVSLNRSKLLPSSDRSKVKQPLAPPPPPSSAPVAKSNANLPPTQINNKGGMAMLKSFMTTNKTTKVPSTTTTKTTTSTNNTGTIAVSNGDTAVSSGAPKLKKLPSTKGMLKRNLQQSYHQRQMKSANAAASNSGGGGGGGNDGGGNASATPTLVNFFKRSNRSSQRGNKDGSGAADSRQPVKFETFTDKDRAAAVLLGDADIKTTLEKQLKSERGRYVLPKESPAQVYLAQADFEMRIGGLSTALGLLNKALELQPNDKNALCSRSRCRLQMGDAKGALADAEEALAGDSLYVKATYQKAEVLYQMGRFEEALVFYHKGVQQRPDMDLFHQGIRKSQEAIEVSLGVKKPTMTQLQQLRSTVANRKKKSSHRHLGKSNSLLSSNGFTSQGTNKRESSLLGDLHVDKLYLENLLLNPGLRNTSVPSSQKIIQHAKDTLEYLKARENFWRQQQPAKIVYPSSIKERSSGRSKIMKRSRRIVSSQINLTSPEESEREQQRTDDGRTDTSNSEGVASHLEECSTSDSNRSRNSANQEEYDETAIEEYNDGHYLDNLRQTTEEMMDYNVNNQLNRCVHVYTSKFISINSLQDDDSKEANLNREIEIKLSRIEGENSETVIDNKTHLVVDIGTLYLANGKEEESMKWAKRALLWAEASSDACATARSLLLLAALAALSGDSDKVTTHLSRAHKILLDDLLMLEEEEEDGEQQQQQSLLITGKDASLEHTDEEEPAVIDAQ